MTYMTKICGLAAAAAMLVVAGCKNFDVVNLNGVGASDVQSNPTAAQMVTAAQSLVTSWRGTDAAHASTLTKYAYEHWQIRTSEPRTLTNIVTQPNVGDFWSYGTIKNIQTFLDLLPNVPGMADSVKAGLRAWFKMNMAVQLEDMAQAHDTFGVVLDLPVDPITQIPPIATKPQVWAKIFQLMDDSYADFLASNYPTGSFRLSSGWAGFNSITTLRQVNRAMKSRWLAIYAQPGNVADWTNVLTTLPQSFISPAQGAAVVGLTTAQLRAGPFHAYEATSTNGLASSDRFSNARIRLEAQCKAVPGAGTCTADSAAATTNRDGRAWGAQAKLRPAPSTQVVTVFGVTGLFKQTDLLNPVQSATISTTGPLPIIRNEELLLIRAEALVNRNQGADLQEAVADLNRIRTGAQAGLPALVFPYVANAALNQPATLLDEVLYEKRASLWGETGTSWLDLRHYGRAAEIPHYDPTFRIIDIFPLPTSECTVRGYATTKGCFLGGYLGIQNGPNVY